MRIPFSRGLVAMFLSLFAFLAVGIGLGGCATTSGQVNTIAVVVDIATSRAIQHGTQDAATWTVRAAKIKAIATQLQALDKGVLVSLPALTQALGPLIGAAGLNPVDAILANDLVIALEAIIGQFTANGANANAQTTIQLVLTDVISVCTAYGG